MPRRSQPAGEAMRAAVKAEGSVVEHRRGVYPRALAGTSSPSPANPIGSPPEPPLPNVSPTLALLAMGALLGGCTDRRAELLASLEPVLPAWDVAHLAVPLEDATADCSLDDLSLAVDELRCYQDVDYDYWCSVSYTPEACYAEISEYCTRKEQPSDACLSGYEAALDGAGVIEPEDCSASHVGLALATAIYTADDAQMEADIVTGVPSFVLAATYSGGSFGGRAARGTTDDGACHVVFKGTDSSTDVVADLESMYLEACTTEDGEPMGDCGDGFIRQYGALRDAGVLDDLRAAVEAGECPAGVYVYGHSLGGAEASLLGAELTVAPLGPTVHVYTYGEPRTFAVDAAEVYATTVDKVRWTRWGDPVVAVPYESMGFAHYGEARELYRSWSGSFFVTQEEDDFAPYGFDPYQHATSAYEEALDAVCPA